MIAKKMAIKKISNKTNIEQQESMTLFQRFSIHFMRHVMSRGLLLTALLFTLPLQAAPNIEHWQTKQGLKVYYVYVPQLPMLDLRLVFSAGSTRDSEKAGLAMMTSAILPMGAAGLNANQLAEAFESVGAGSSNGAARDMAWLTLRTLTLPEEQEKAINTWLKVITHPDFPEKDFARMKKQTLVSLQAEKQSPSAIANKAFFKHLYGDHPYASPQNGTEASINALTIADLKAFYQEYYVAKNGILAIVGNIDKSAAEQLATRLSTQLAEGKKAAPIPEVKPLAKAQTIRIPFPSQQAHIMIGQPGDKRGDKDYFTLYLGNHIMGGGGFTSRLMKEVRDARGLSYSVYSYFSAMKENGPFLLALQTKLSQTDEAINVARDVLIKFQKEGASAEELIAAKKDVNGGFPLNVASNSDIVEYLAMIGFYNLPLDYLNTFTQKIDAITQADILDAFQRRLTPEKMLTVIVGGEANEKTENVKKAESVSEAKH